MVAFATHHFRLVKTDEPWQDLTEQQREVLVAIAYLLSIRGLYPTYAQVGDCIGISAGAVAARIAPIWQRGLVTTEYGVRRSVRITDLGRKALRAWGIESQDDRRQGRLFAEVM